MNNIELKVSDIKQYLYCPRVVYFYYVLPVQAKSTFKMEYGKDQHIKWEELEKRRTYKKYKLSEGERIFNSFFVSDRLGLAGKLDLLIKTPEEYVPVEFKYTSGEIALSHRYQLVAYAMLVEDVYHLTIRRGFVYLIMLNKLEEIIFTQDARLQVKKVLEKIRNMIKKEIMPEANRFRSCCRDCEYLNFCGDVW